MELGFCPCWPRSRDGSLKPLNRISFVCRGTFRSQFRNSMSLRGVCIGLHDQHLFHATQHFPSGIFLSLHISYLWRACLSPFVFIPERAASKIRFRWFRSEISLNGNLLYTILFHITFFDLARSYGFGWGIGLYPNFTVFPLLKSMPSFLPLAEVCTD